MCDPQKNASPLREVGLDSELRDLIFDLKALLLAVNDQPDKNRLL